jgi:hypothetical protein
MNVSAALPLPLLEVGVISRLVRRDLRMLVKRIIDTRLQRSSGVRGRECRAIKGVRKKDVQLNFRRAEVPKHFVSGGQAEIDMLHNEYSKILLPFHHVLLHT